MPATIVNTAQLKNPKGGFNKKYLHMRETTHSGPHCCAPALVLPGLRYRWALAVACVVERELRLVCLLDWSRHGPPPLWSPSMSAYIAHAVWSAQRAAHHVASGYHEPPLGDMIGSMLFDQAWIVH